MEFIGGHGDAERTESGRRHADDETEPVVRQGRSCQAGHVSRAVHIEVAHEEAAHTCGQDGTDHDHLVGEHEGVRRLHEGPEDQVDEDARHGERPVILPSGAHHIGQRDPGGHHDEAHHIDGPQEGTAGLFHFQHDDWKDRRMVHAAHDGRPDEEARDDAAQDGAHGKGCIDQAADPVTDERRKGRDEEIDDETCDQARDAARHDIGRRGRKIQLKAADEQVFHKGPCEDTADHAADEAALHGQDARDDTGYDRHIAEPGDLVAGDGRHDDRQRVDHGIEDGLKIPKARDLADDQRQSHGDEARQRCHQHAVEADAGEEAPLFHMRRVTLADGRMIGQVPLFGEGEHIGDGPCPVGRPRGARNSCHMEPHRLRLGHRGAARADRGQLLLSGCCKSLRIGPFGIGTDQDGAVDLPGSDLFRDGRIFLCRPFVHFRQGTLEDERRFRPVPGPEPRMFLRFDPVHGGAGRYELDGADLHAGRPDLTDELTQQIFRVLPAEMVQIPSAAAEDHDLFCHDATPLQDPSPEDARTAGPLSGSRDPIIYFQLTCFSTVCQ